MNKKFLAAAAALAGGLIVGTAAPASASAAATVCDQRHLCMWEDTYYQGDMYLNIYMDAEANIGTVGEIDGWDGDNEISSLSNGTRFSIALYDGDGGTGERLRCYNPNLDVPIVIPNDRAESYKVLRGYTC
ncbi:MULTISPECIES: peptidase inhibitor family I36 protein [unclassified Streptomyces]|uniref:peptidase inhibitor family I36 protein n=1 Tax=unclassified Streptomyces TaxID=2593676 RepID=UPI00366446F4